MCRQIDRRTYLSHGECMVPKIGLWYAMWVAACTFHVYTLRGGSPRPDRQETPWIRETFYDDIRSNQT
jgi:hypothetical protein